MDWILQKSSLLFELMPFLAKGLFVTVQISFVGLVCGSVLGLALGTVQTLNIRAVNAAVFSYVHVLRGSPYLVQLYIAYFVLPASGIPFLNLSSFAAAILSLALYTSSYMTEVVSAAIKAVPSGQDEAARATGMSKAQSLIYIVLPQAVPIAIPPMAGIFVIIIKSTAILSVIGIAELTRQGEVAILRMPTDTMFIYTLIAAVYFIYCYPLLKLADWAESRMSR